MKHAKRLHEVASRALVEWGATDRMNQTAEECAEFIASLSRMRRGRTGAQPVAKEIADVIFTAACARLVIADRVDEELELVLNEVETLLDAGCRTREELQAKLAAEVAAKRLGQ